jgi:fucose 4-O-acetylase-like acetyltransferase
MDWLNELLEPLAAWFRGLGIPEAIVHWGHPAMMGIVVFVMGSFVGWAGWKARLTQDEEVSGKSRQQHRQIAPLMFIFMALGYTGGVLSLVMQKHTVGESPHFWTGGTVLLLLLINGAIAFVGFGKETPKLRKFHAYLGSTALIAIVVHALLGLKLGLSL